MKFLQHCSNTPEHFRVQWNLIKKTVHCDQFLFTRNMSFGNLVLRVYLWGAPLVNFLASPYKVISSCVESFSRGHPDCWHVFLRSKLEVHDKAQREPAPTASTARMLPVIVLTLPWRGYFFSWLAIIEKFLQREIVEDLHRITNCPVSLGAGINFASQGDR